jgi:hypothetical protein
MPPFRQLHAASGKGAGEVSTTGSRQCRVQGFLARGFQHYP